MTGTSVAINRALCQFPCQQHHGENVLWGHSADVDMQGHVHSRTICNVNITTSTTNITNGFPLFKGTLSARYLPVSVTLLYFRPYSIFNLRAFSSFIIDVLIIFIKRTANYNKRVYVWPFSALLFPRWFNWWGEDPLIHEYMQRIKNLIML